MVATLQIALIKMLKTPSGPSLRLRSVAEVAQHAWGPGGSRRVAGLPSLPCPPWFSPHLAPQHPILQARDQRPRGSETPALNAGDRMPGCGPEPV